jgi:hypothetical protein
MVVGVSEKAAVLSGWRRGVGGSASTLQLVSFVGVSCPRVTQSIRGFRVLPRMLLTRY